MSRRNKIIYWIATIWLSLGMISSGVVQLIPLEEEVVRMNALGYPVYFITIIGAWKLLGVIAVLINGFPLVQEWAYAGFFFLMSGAVFSHLAMNDPAAEYFGPVLLLLLTLVSWHFRPIGRKLTMSTT